MPPQSWEQLLNHKKHNNHKNHECHKNRKSHSNNNNQNNHNSHNVDLTSKLRVAPKTEVGLTGDRTATVDVEIDKKCFVGLPCKGFRVPWARLADMEFFKNQGP